MIRFLQSQDAPDLLALLHWMDAAPEREVFAPSARQVGALLAECGESACYVALNDAPGEEGVVGYCALVPFRDGMVIEGPLSETGERLTALLRRALAHAEGLPVYAFCARDNLTVRDSLEAVGLTPMHSTAFYTAAVKPKAQPELPAGYALVNQLPLEAYRSLYRAAEETWAVRLHWTPEEFEAHFKRPEVQLLALTRAGQPVAFAEIEFNSEEGRADLTHLAVHPAERGQHLGRTLLHLAAHAAAQRPEIRLLRARAHDHMHAARALYARAGLTHSRSVVTYLMEGQEEA